MHAWANAIESSGTASMDEIAAATEASLAQFAPDLDTQSTKHLANSERALPPDRG